MTTSFQILPALTKKQTGNSNLLGFTLCNLCELINSALLKHQVEFPAERLL